MTIVDKNASKKVLRAIYLKGGTATNKDIRKITGYKGQWAYSALSLLTQRGLITKERIQVPIPGFNLKYNQNIYRLSQKRIDKAMQMIEEVNNVDKNISEGMG